MVVGLLAVLSAGAVGATMLGVAIGHGIVALSIAAIVWKFRVSAVVVAQVTPEPGDAWNVPTVAALGAAFSIGIMAAVMAADGSQLSGWLAPLVALQMATGAILLAAVPLQAICYLAGSTPALVLVIVHAFDSSAVVAAQVGVAVMLTLSVISRWTGLVVDARERRAFRLDRQYNLIDLLTARRGGRTRDILWLTDRHGRLADVCSGGGLLLRRADGLGAVEGLVAGRLLDDVLAALCPQDVEAQDQHARFRAAMELGRPVQDLPVPVRISGSRPEETQQRWWSVSARPWVDRGGQPQGWIGVFSDVTDARAAQVALRHRADFDSLTGLANRGFLTSSLDAVLRTVESGQAVAVMLIDLDHFKAVNDTHGHAAGDAVLAAVGRRLRACLRAEDVAARLGGDEFALALPGLSDPDQLRTLADRLIAQISMPCPHEGALLRVGATVGIAVSPLHGRSSSELMERADMALYAAKAAGRGQFALFDQGIEDQRRRSGQLGHAVCEAISAGRLELVWQPRFAAQRLTMVDARATPCLQHAALGQVSMDEVVAAAEEGGKTAELWRWLVFEACRQATAMPHHCNVTIGLPYSSARLVDLPGLLELASKTTGLAVCRLQVEVDGPGAASCDADDWCKLGQLQALGVRVALSGFGVGQGSLAILRQHRFDQLQLHGLLLQIRGAPETALAVLRGLVNLARSLGMSTLAMGIESQAQVQLARSAGCDVLEGGVAVPPQPLHDLMRRTNQALGTSVFADERTLAVMEDVAGARLEDLDADGRRTVG